MRAFIALPLPPSDAEVIEALQDRLPLGRAVPPENLHLTLAFLDDQPDAMIDAVHDALSALRAAPFTLKLSDFQSFGGQTGQALALMGDGGDALRDLQKRILSRLHGIGLELDRRRFRPHVTIARLPGRLNPDAQDKLGRFLMREGVFSLPDIRIDRFALYRSTLHRDGAIHDRLADYPLKALDTP